MDNKRGQERGGMKDRDWHIYTIDTMYKVGNEWESAVQRRGLDSMLCGDLNGKGIQKEWYM